MGDMADFALESIDFASRPGLTNEMLELDYGSPEHDEACYEEYLNGCADVQAKKRRPMPTVTRSFVRPAGAVAAAPLGKGKRAAPAINPAADPNHVTLPTEYREPTEDFNAYSILLHGDKKIGKTSLANRGGNVLFLQCDPSQQAYRIKEVLIRNWKQFESAIGQLETAFAAGERPYDRIVIDRIDVLYSYAMAQALEEMGLSHPSTTDYGKSWAAIKNLFGSGIDRFFTLPCGRWFLCHSAWKETTTREGESVEKLVPVMPGQCEGIVNGKVDAWIAYDYKGPKRILIVRGDERTGAGNRMDEEGHGRFITPKGEKIVEIDAGDSPTAAYNNLIAAFNNKQTYTHVYIAPTPPDPNVGQAVLIAGKGKGKK